jgi:hypothetical protein
MGIEPGVPVYLVPRAISPRAIYFTCSTAGHMFGPTICNRHGSVPVQGLVFSIQPQTESADVTWNRGGIAFFLGMKQARPMDL